MLPGVDRILDDQTVAYLDFIGSGIETAAHLSQNGRVCVMFCAFAGAPRIVRLHGTGEVIEPGEEGFEKLRAQFPPDGGVRSVVLIRVERVSDSCGYGVPLYRFENERTQLQAWATRKGADELQPYQRQKNARSLDGLPGLRWASRD